jgi:hypothetical protein
MRGILDLTKFVLQFNVIVTDITIDIHVTTQSVSDVMYCMWHILRVFSMSLPYPSLQHGNCCESFITY